MLNRGGGIAILARKDMIRGVGYERHRTPYQEHDDAAGITSGDPRYASSVSGSMGLDREDLVVAFMCDSLEMLRGAFHLENFVCCRRRSR